MKDKKYIESLENVIKRMLRPIKNIPLNLVIEGLSGYRILYFDKNEPDNAKLLSDLIEISKHTMIEVNKSGIKRTRANEVGNDIEGFVKKSLKWKKYKASTPRSLQGNKKSTGYPDIEFVDIDGRMSYLECKTYNKDNINTSQRSFYLSPSEDFKITKDAYHFVVSFEVYVDRRSGRSNIYRCSGWKILSLESLEVDVKYEFNSDNKRLYSKCMVLAESKK